MATRTLSPLVDTVSVLHQPLKTLAVTMPLSSAKVYSMVTSTDTFLGALQLLQHNCKLHHFVYF